MNKKSSVFFKTGWLISAFILTICLVFNSCTTGLGAKLDTEAPVLKILTPSNMDYVASHYSVTGTCEDEFGVKTIEVRNTKTEELLGKAQISGNTWIYNGVQEINGELPLTFTAIDAAGNTAEASIGQLTIVIDSESPELKSLYIKRVGKYSIYFSNKDILEEYINNKDNTESKDYLQNESVEITGTVSDNIRASKAVLTLYDENDKIILSDINQDDGSSAYTPVFTITQNQLETADSAFKTGSHIVYLKLDLYDAAGETAEVYKKYFCWYPESDNPKVDFTIANNNSIEVEKNTIIPVNVFDDDGISTIYSKIVSYEEWNKIYNKENRSFDYTGFNEKTSEGSRDLSIKETAASAAGDYVFAVAVEDKKSDGSDSVWTYDWCNVTVNADNVPILLVDSPSENSAPALTKNKFTIKAYSLYDKYVEKAAIAWIPAGYGETNGIIKAHEILSSISFDSTVSDVDSESGIKYETLVVTQDGNEIVGSKSYKKSSFSKEFDVTTYFTYGDEIENTVKTFVLYVKSPEGNEVYKTFRLGSYSDGPSISVKKGSVELDDLVTNIKAGTTYNLTISASGYNGLTLKSLTGSWKRESDRTSTEITGLDATKENAFALEIEGEERYTLTFVAEDIFGTKASVVKTFVPGELARLSKFTSGMKTGIILTAGETLTMQAEFTNTVSEMNGTKIQLTGIKGVTENQYAVCNEDNDKETDTVVYTYTVPDGVYTESGVRVDSDTKILDSDGTTKYTLSDTTETLGKTTAAEDNSEIYIDAVAPKIVTYSPEANKVIGDDKTIKITFDDAIYLESGTITVERTSGWAIPPVLTSDEFTTIYAALSDDEKIAMIGSTDGNPVLTENSAMPVGPYKKVTQGVKKCTTDSSFVDKSGDAVPDSSTKYVLAFDYDIFDTTPGGAVQTIREALENYGYHKVDFDLSDSGISIAADGKTLVIDLSGTDLLVNGREFTVILPAGSIRDEAGNVNKALVRDSYKFWSQKTATPVIRTDRYTHGADAVEPYLDDESVIRTKKVGTEDVTTAPTGKIRVRIDCETPGADIMYGLESNKSTSVSKVVITSSKTVANLSMDNFEKLECNNTYNSIFLAGDSGWDHAEKNYIKAVATKTADTVKNTPALTSSDAGYEMATKTVIYYSKPSCYDSIEFLYFQGSDSIGEPITAGFPMRDANPDMKWSRYAYNVSYETDTPVAKANATDWVCVSWDIITSDWRLQSITQNWQNPEKKGLDYGILYYSIYQGYYN